MRHLVERPGGHAGDGGLRRHAPIAASTSAAAAVAVGTDVDRPARRRAAATYGAKGATLAGEVRGSGRTPTGTVTVKAGSTVLGTATLVGRRATP